MLYLEYEYTIAVFVDKLKTNKQIEKWLIMLCDGVISASQSLMGFLFLASGIFIAGKLGIPIKLGDADIAMADEILLVFLFFPACQHFRYYIHIKQFALYSNPYIYMCK